MDACSTRATSGSIIRLVPSRIESRRTSASPLAPPSQAPFGQRLNISATSFGALVRQRDPGPHAGARRVTSARMITGEGFDQQPPPRVHGGDLIWEIGSSCYFGGRDRPEGCPPTQRSAGQDHRDKISQGRCRPWRVAGARRSRRNRLGAGRAGGRDCVAPLPTVPLRRPWR